MFINSDIIYYTLSDSLMNILNVNVESIVLLYFNYIAYFQLVICCCLNNWFVNDFKKYKGVFILK